MEGSFDDMQRSSRRGGDPAMDSSSRKRLEGGLRRIIDKSDRASHTRFSSEADASPKKGKGRRPLNASSSHSGEQLQAVASSDGGLNNSLSTFRSTDTRTSTSRKEGRSSRQHVGSSTHSGDHHHAEAPRIRRTGTNRSNATSRREGHASSEHSGDPTRQPSSSQASDGAAPRLRRAGTRTRRERSSTDHHHHHHHEQQPSDTNLDNSLSKASRRSSTRPLKDGRNRPSHGLEDATSVKEEPGEELDDSVPKLRRAGTRAKREGCDRKLEKGSSDRRLLMKEGSKRRLRKDHSNRRLRKDGSDRRLKEGSDRRLKDDSDTRSRNTEGAGKRPTSDRHRRLGDASHNQHHERRRMSDSNKESSEPRLMSESVRDHERRRDSNRNPERRGQRDSERRRRREGMEESSRRRTSRQGEPTKSRRRTRERAIRSKDTYIPPPPSRGGELLEGDESASSRGPRDLAPSKEFLLDGSAGSAGSTAPFESKRNQDQETQFTWQRSNAPPRRNRRRQSAMSVAHEGGANAPSAAMQNRRQGRTNRGANVLQSQIAHMVQASDDRNLDPSEEISAATSEELVENDTMLLPEEDLNDSTSDMNQPNKRTSKALKVAGKASVVVAKSGAHATMAVAKTSAKTTMVVAKTGASATKAVAKTGAKAAGKAMKNVMSFGKRRKNHKSMEASQAGLIYDEEESSDEEHIPGLWDSMDEVPEHSDADLDR